MFLYGSMTDAVRNYGLKVYVVETVSGKLFKSKNKYYVTSFLANQTIVFHVTKWTVFCLTAVF